MKRVLNWAIIMCACSVAAIVIGFFATGDGYPVGPLVTDDPSLPSQTVAGVQLHLKVIDGPMGAPTIIVLHGGPGGDFRSLEALDALSDQFRLVFFDQRGAGLSERVPAEMLTLDGHLNELEAVIDLVSPDEAPILIGHSWGAMLATAYLGQNPKDVRAAVLIEPGYIDQKGQVAWQTERPPHFSGFHYWREAILTGFRANQPDNSSHCGERDTTPGWRFGGLESDAWDQSPKNGLDHLVGRAAYFADPVLIMAGLCNFRIGAPLPHRHLSLFSAAELSIIPDAGHNVIWDNPNGSLRAIRLFLNARNWG